uniref:TorF family putative porin n=1 Tax=Candidatus Electrothrix sp. TaxID=2170559 RepID=UPI0040565732
MTNFIKFLTAVFASNLLAISAHAADAEVSTSVDLNSAYCYHGITYNDGVVIQPGLDISKNGFGINVWTNFDLGDYDGTLAKNEFSEVDLSAYYCSSVAGFDWCLTYAEYLFPHVANAEGNGALEGTREVIFALDRDLFAGFRAQTKLQYDVDEINDLYARLLLAYDHKINEVLSATVTASGAYAGDDVALTGKGGLHDYDISFSMTWKFSEDISLGGNVHSIGSLDEDVLPDQEVNFYGGFSLTASL